MKITQSVFVIRKNTSSIEEKDLSNVIINRVTKGRKNKKTTVQLKISNQESKTCSNENCLFFVIRKNASSIEERDLSNVISSSNELVNKA